MVDKEILSLSASASSKFDEDCTHGLNNSTGNGVMRASGVNSQGAEPVHRAGSARRGIDGVFGERHGDDV